MKTSECNSQTLNLWLAQGCFFFHILSEEREMKRVKCREREQDGKNYKRAKKTNGLAVHFVCTSAIVRAPIPPTVSFPRSIVTTARPARRGFIESACMGKGTCALLRSAPRSSMASVLESASYSHDMHDSYFSDMSIVSCDVRVQKDKLSSGILFNLLATLNGGVLNGGNSALLPYIFYIYFSGANECLTWLLQMSLLHLQIQWQKEKN